MKLITAIIRPFKLDAVQEALSKMDVQGMTITEVKGFGRQQGRTELYRSAEYLVNFLPKIKIEVVVQDDSLQSVIDAITEVSKTGQVGDGKIFISELQEVVRIRTGETSGDAV